MIKVPSAWRPCRTWAVNYREDLPRTQIGVLGLFACKVFIGHHSRGHICRMFGNTVYGLEGNSGWMGSKIWMVGDLEIL